MQKDASRIVGGKFSQGLYTSVNIVNAKTIFGLITKQRFGNWASLKN